MPRIAATPSAGVMRLLRARPDGCAIGADIGHGAGRAHARMRLERPFVSRLDHFRGIGESRIDIAFVDVHLALHRLGVADQVIERVLRRERRFRVRPGDLERLGGADRVPFARRDDGEKPLLPDDLDAGNILDRGFVDRGRDAAGDLRANAAGVQHAGHFDVDDELSGAEDLRGHVAAPHIRADDLVFARRFRLGRAGISKSGLPILPFHCSVTSK